MMKLLPITAALVAAGMLASQAQADEVHQRIEKLEQESRSYHLECLRLTDGEGLLQGVLLFDATISDARKGFLASTFARLSGQRPDEATNSSAHKESCQVSPEERAHLFSFMRQGESEKK